MWKPSFSQKRAESHSCSEFASAGDDFGSVDGPIDVDSPSPKKSKAEQMDPEVAESLAQVFAKTVKALSETVKDTCIQIDEE